MSNEYSVLKARRGELLEDLKNTPQYIDEMCKLFPEQAVKIRSAQNERIRQIKEQLVVIEKRLKSLLTEHI